MSFEIKKHKKSKKSKDSDEECEKAVDTSISVSDVDESHRKKHKKSKKSKRTEDEMKEEAEETVIDTKKENTTHKKHKESKKSKIERQSEDEDAKEKVGKKGEEELVKPEAKVVIPEVHTANNWEKVDLGDDQRKLKFLKLMGAGKHQDSGDNQIKSRALRDNKKVEEDLEKQFTTGLTSKMLAPKHQGLGASSRPEPQNVRKTFSDSDNDDRRGSEVAKPAPVAEVPKKTTEYQGFNATAESKLKFKKMSFVKSSS